MASAAPEGTQQGICRSCRAKVLWVFTAAGKEMPLDLEPRADGNLVLLANAKGFHRAHVADPTGQAEMFPTPKYVSHFATCPNAEEWRRPR